MASVDPRSPVLVGVGQLTWTDRSTPTSPLELMTEAAHRAVRDTGCPNRVLSSIGSLTVVDILSWNAPDPAAALATELGADPTETVTTHTSGTSPLDALRDAAGKIRSGELDMTLIAGAEAVKSLSDGRYSGGPDQPEGTAPARTLGTDRHPTHEVEEAAGMLSPVMVYPLFENALRSANGTDIGSHDEWLGTLWARLAKVAGNNPHAWLGEPPTAESIVDTSIRNRMVSLPYRKLLTANIYVDQGAALVLCSASAAEAAGIPRDRWIFLHATAGAHDHWYVGQREHLHRSPAIRANGQAAMRHAGITIDEIAHLDLYSCFPSAVQVAASELGIDLPTDQRELTVTGGLTFAGGPGSNYVTHSLAAMVDRLRADPSGTGMCTGVGWYLTKHALAILSATPPRTPYADHDTQHEVDALPRREIVPGGGATAPVETYTVGYSPDGVPATAHVSCLLEDGCRTFASTSDPDQVTLLAETDPLGRQVHLPGDGSFHTS